MTLHILLLSLIVISITLLISSSHSIIIPETTQPLDILYKRPTPSPTPSSSPPITSSSIKYDDTEQQQQQQHQRQRQHHESTTIIFNTRDSPSYQAQIAILDPKEHDFDINIPVLSEFSSQIHIVVKNIPIIDPTASPKDYLLEFAIEGILLRPSNSVHDLDHPIHYITLITNGVEVVEGTTNGVVDEEDDGLNEGSSSLISQQDKSAISSISSPNLSSERQVRGVDGHWFALPDSSTSISKSITFPPLGEQINTSNTPTTSTTSTKQYRITSLELVMTIALHQIEKSPLKLNNFKLTTNKKSLNQPHFLSLQSPNLDKSTQFTTKYEQDKLQQTEQSFVPSKTTKTIFTHTPSLSQSSLIPKFSFLPVDSRVGLYSRGFMIEIGDVVEGLGDYTLVLGSNATLPNVEKNQDLFIKNDFLAHQGCDLEIIAHDHISSNIYNNYDMESLDFDIDDEESEVERVTSFNTNTLSTHQIQHLTPGIPLIPFCDHKNQQLYFNLTDALLNAGNHHHHQSLEVRAQYLAREFLPFQSSLSKSTNTTIPPGSTIRITCESTLFHLPPPPTTTTLSSFSSKNNDNSVLPLFNSSLSFTLMTLIKGIDPIPDPITLLSHQQRHEQHGDEDMPQFHSQQQEQQYQQQQQQYQQKQQQHKQLTSLQQIHISSWSSQPMSQSEPNQAVNPATWSWLRIVVVCGLIGIILLICSVVVVIRIIIPMVTTKRSLKRATDASIAEATEGSASSVGIGPLLIGAGQIHHGNDYNNTNNNNTLNGNNPHHWNTMQHYDLLTPQDYEFIMD